MGKTVKSRDFRPILLGNAKRSLSTLGSAYNLSDVFEYLQKVNGHTIADNYHKWYYFRCPKAATNTVAKVLREHFGWDNVLHTGQREYLINWVLWVTKLRPELWESGTKFTVVRHPYDRFVSYYRYFFERKFAYTGMTDPDFPGFGHTIHEVVENLDSYAFGWSIWNHKLPCTYFTYHKGKCMVDKVLRVESLKGDLGELLGTQIDELPELNKTVGRSIAEYGLEDKHWDILDRYYAEDFENFGYERWRP